MTPAPDAQERRRRRCVGLAVGLALASLVGAAPDSARAQDAEPAALSSEDKARLIELLSAANAAFDAGRYEAAASAYEDALALRELSEVHYRLALCYDKLGRDADAIAAYRRFLELEPEARERGRIETELERLAARLEAASRATLRIVSEPHGAEVRLGGSDTVLGVTPLELELEPGESTVVLALPGREPVERTVVLEAGGVVELGVVLVPVEEESPEPVPEPPLVDGGDRPSDDLALAGWLTLGGGLVLGGVATGLYLAAEGAAEEANAFGLREDGSNRDALEGLEREAEGLALATWIVAGLGAATALTGATLAIVALSSGDGAGEDGEAEQAVELGGLVVPGGGHVTLRLRF